MLAQFDAHWQNVTLAVIVTLSLVWWLWRRAGNGRSRYHAPDALDEGTAPAARNQALIDAPRTAPILREAAPEPVAAVATAAGDDLSLIKGVGPKLVALLGTLGVTRFDQIARWTADDIADIDAKLGTFAGRIARDSWVEQCRYLAAGDRVGFEGRFGRV